MLPASPIPKLYPPPLPQPISGLLVALYTFPQQLPSLCKPSTATIHCRLPSKPCSLPSLLPNLLPPRTPSVGSMPTNQSHVRLPGLSPAQPRNPSTTDLQWCLCAVADLRILVYCINFLPLLFGSHSPAVLRNHAKFVGCLCDGKLGCRSVVVLWGEVDEGFVYGAACI